MQGETVRFSRTHWKAIFAGIGIFLLFAILPALFIHSARRWQNFASWVAWFYALTAFFTFIAIVVTAFLAVQQLRASGYSQMYTHLATVNTMLIENLDKMKIKGEQSVFTEEHFSFYSPERHLAGMIFTLFESIYYQYEKFSALGEEDWKVWKGVIKRTFRDIPYIQKCWEQTSHRGYTREFRMEIEKIRDEPDTPELF